MRAITSLKGAHTETSKILWALPIAAVLALLLMTQAPPGSADPAESEAGSRAPEFIAALQAAKMRELTGYIGERFDVPRPKAATIVTEAVRNGQAHGLHPELILAVIAVESTFNEKAVSRCGARGLMQIMPRSHPKAVKRIGGVRALVDPRKNIATGSRILAQHLDRSRGNLRRALLRYNGSLHKCGSRFPDKVLRVYREMRKVTELAQRNLLAQLDSPT